MKVAFSHVNLLDGTENMQLQKDVVVHIDNDTIISIDSKVKEGYQEINLEGKYMCPGLINLHAHIPASGKPSQTGKALPILVKILSSNPIGKAIINQITAKQAEVAFLSGATTIRGVGGLVDSETKVRDQINARKRMGPRILTANTAISVEGGHMAESLATKAHNEQEARMMVRKLAEQKVDLIKLMITGGVLDADDDGTPGVLKMSPEIVKAACDEAKKYNLEVAAHVESSEGVRVALENGVHTIEHGAYLDDYLIDLFKKTGATLTTTLSPVMPIFFDTVDPSMNELYKKNGAVVMKGMIDAAKKALENNILVGLGTDTGCPYITQYDTWREMAYFVKLVGVSPEKALYSCTLGNAKVIHLDTITGSIEPGKKAELIVMNNNPLEDFSIMKKLELIMKDGKITYHPVVKRVKEYDDLLDAIDLDTIGGN